MLQLLAGSGNLLLFARWGVGVHQRQTDVRLRHQYGEYRNSLHAFSLQFFVQDGHRVTCAVATRRNGIAIVLSGSIAELQTSDELPHDTGWLPAVRGKTEANALVLLQFVGGRIGA